MDYDATSKWWRIRYDDEYTDFVGSMEEDSNSAETAHAIRLFLQQTSHSPMETGRGKTCGSTGGLAVQGWIPEVLPCWERG